mmetsp:Transcript_78809/g.149791  ORF Transcript_78809/g.149791 Transcript_78809/m.149791 type:complete len:201 (+) Transcript_78809:2919-3521(+)
MWLGSICHWRCLRCHSRSRWGWGLLLCLSDFVSRVACLLLCLPPFISLNASGFNSSNDRGSRHSDVRGCSARLFGCGLLCRLPRRHHRRLGRLCLAFGLVVSLRCLGHDTFTFVCWAAGRGRVQLLELLVHCTASSLLNVTSRRSEAKKSTNQEHSLECQLLPAEDFLRCRTSSTLDRIHLRHCNNKGARLGSSVWLAGT